MRFLLGVWFSLGLGMAPAPAVEARDLEADRALRYLGYVKVEPTGEALRRATTEGRTYTIDLLLAAGVSIDSAAEDGTTALMVAAETGSAPVLTHFLEKGAAIDAVNRLGETALVAALEPPKDHALHALLDAGASVDIPDVQGRRALHRAIVKGRPETVEALLQAGAAAWVEGDFVAPLELAWKQGDLATIKALVDRGAPPVEWNPATTSFFWKAYRERDPGAMDLLQRSHATPPGLPGADQPLLAVAVLWQDPAFVRRLLQWGADPNTALRIPASETFIQTTGKPGLAYYLENEPGMTVLMLAAGLGCSDAVSALLEAGAHRNQATGHYQMIAQSFAGRTGNAESLLLLLGRSPRPQDQAMTIHISITTQMATVYKKGVPWLKTSVSTGREEFPTPTGRFVITDKHRSRVSTIYDVPMPYFMRLSGRDFGMHEGYVPGYAASHGCIRLPADVARQLFKEADVGTLVTIGE